MRIGVDACCWGNKRGFGRFTRELLWALTAIDKSNDYLFFVDSKTDDLDDIPTNVRTIVVDTEHSQVKTAAADGRRSLRDVWAMSRGVLKHRIDTFFFPAVYSYFPIVNRAKIVLTIHDVIADHHPELVFPNTKSKLFWKLKQGLAIRQADIIATVSDYSKKEIARYFRLPESRLKVVSEAARPVFRTLPTNEGCTSALAKYGLRPDEPFLLYVGGISPHKNLTTLVAAFEIIAAGRPKKPFKLVLAGDYKDDPFFSAYPALKRQVSELGLADLVYFTGFVPDEDLAYLYNAAELLVFPSLEEGFGLPAVEALACGTPVAASKTGSLPEVLGAAGRFFDPLNAEEMASVILEILADDQLRGRMKAAGLARSQASGWERGARELLEIFDELGGQGAFCDAKAA